MLKDNYKKVAIVHPNESVRFNGSISDKTFTYQAPSFEPSVICLLFIAVQSGTKGVFFIDKDCEINKEWVVGGGVSYYLKKLTKEEVLLNIQTTGNYYMTVTLEEVIFIE